ncbi:2-amino-4-hydroxy-6-hydroxymethyldihydropteridine diphosphokinase [Asticcacaulis sp. EMRT-3]|uniref:2-amino-4-hydroxy-6- hydroxymethyldihydropteridine diphosphokinase n=1 Tax=Asticcacaulis sp. EMRT-3 TaxID=3040349 RepID=UPI0024AFFC7F|nr:2-amino-4-hydroxy-6-hydroxymethyldihydropteridine diphosphokinase [Asticcacaulis sp. EMRT-3]MDI7774361.1 2-amino-4-hydroxy-6-hydroxymethyldihydropteridine diphosphokinase [Asticcacaulis sp. EMRT-3]
MTADTEIIVAYGANLTPPDMTASQAFAALVKTLEARGLTMIAISRLWHSKAWPDPADPPYYNAVMVVETELPPQALLALLHEVEREAGRLRQPGLLNAPRTLDLDLIAYGRRVMTEDGLILPHPRSHERGFVMGPLAEIRPDWLHPELGRTATDLYREVSVGRDAQPVS